MAPKPSKAPELFINRELSWLQFNQRVLDQALDPAVPPLERLKFLAITAANLDEFYMVRVGGLQLLKRLRNRKKDIAGMTPKQQLLHLGQGLRKMCTEQYRCLQELEPLLREKGIRRLQPEELNEEQAAYAEKHFMEQVFPVLTPMAVSDTNHMPLLKGLTLHIAAVLDPAKNEEEPRFAVLPVGLAADRMVTLPSRDGCYDYLLIEELIRQYAHHWFRGETLRECIAFQVTRNADLNLDDEGEDLVEQMSEVLDARTRGHCVRLEIEAGASRELVHFLEQALHMEPKAHIPIDGPIDLRAFFRLAGLDDYEELQDPPWPPLPAPEIDPRASLLSQLDEKEFLLQHPYETFDPVIRLVEEAAEDPDVLAIKQILYRVSPDSPITRALARAAARGKYVTAIVELKARFDEARNIEWATQLERAGVQVIYGIRGLKTHAKVCVVLRRTPTGIRRYAHFGTGNYNEKTARLYTDYSYLTAHEDLGADATTFFNTITGYSQPQPLRKLHMSPNGIRNRILEMIESEIAFKKQGQKAQIILKCNSLQHPEIIRALYRASQEGVKIHLNVRGICCLRPGVKDLSENITAVSVIDRFLEHSRVYYFRHGGDDQVFISSADLMVRNLDKRIELMIPIENPAFRQRLREDLKTMLRDNVKGRLITPNGCYTDRTDTKSKKVRSQEVLYKELLARQQEATNRKPIVFEPHRPPANE